MARVRPDQPLLPSVLDRLIDDDPAVTTEPPRARTQMLRELKLAVRRDLEHLLNTRRRAVSVPAGFTELDRSLLTYGLPDFSGAGPGGGKERDAFCRTIEAVIRQHEPRFLSVAVDLVTGADPTDRTLRFRIDAVLRADPVPEPVVFDSTLEPATGTFAVGGGAA
jgi:type VI secretion system protein ImpF